MTLPRRGWQLVLLDRDGTLVVAPREGQYLVDPNDVRLVTGAEAALARLQDAGMALAVVTNQRCLARGIATWEQVRAVNERTSQLLGTVGSALAWYVCPHEAGECSCRKPLPGLVRRVVDDVGVPCASAVVVGDRETDVEAGLPDDLGRVLLSDESSVRTVAHVVVPDLGSAVDAILASRC